MQLQASGDGRNACSTTERTIERKLPNGGAYEPTHSRLKAYGLLRREGLNQIFGDSHVEQAYCKRFRCRPLPT